jgi:hypothetical protein
MHNTINTLAITLDVKEGLQLAYIYSIYVRNTSWWLTFYDKMAITDGNFDARFEVFKVMIQAAVFCFAMPCCHAAPIFRNPTISLDGRVL